jgi:hydrogenase maturation protein HypF
LTSESRVSYRIEGIVQGVGFRPFVYSLAVNLGLSGFVLNNALGVFIEVQGCLEHLEAFEEALIHRLPPLARIDFWQKENLTCKDQKEGFSILQSDATLAKSSLVLPDMALCEDCLRELNDPTNRRFGYFFINCTNCGPRYSIIKTVPYDRPKTSMAPFIMCEACEKEYRNPLDRRYHAQPISCAKCGPSLSLRSLSNELLASDEAAIKRLAELIHQGHIVAMKGMGGFHLMCDATDDSALQKLRARKHRPTKPFAVMFKDIEAVQSECDMTLHEQQGVLSQLRPIVLLKRFSHLSKISPLVAPHTDRLGVFLPYTPLHVMLFQTLQVPIVATSANRSGEPIIADAQTLVSKLGNVIEYYLDYNREIVHRSDDSVMQFVGNKTLLMRASRGIAPHSFRLNAQDNRAILAVGAHQKNAIAIYLNHQVIISPYIGDLDNVASNALFEEMIDAFARFYDFKPDLIVGDLHPNYASTQWAKKQGIPFVQVQHHYAHILSAMCEYDLNEKVLGLAWDGTGYGDDGTIWGSECLICDKNGYERVASLEPFFLLGGDAGIKETRRILASMLWQSLGDAADSILLRYFDENSLKRLKQLYTKKINAPSCSSMGRLFDAVAVLCGMDGEVSYDGESGLWLESLYDATITEAYHIEIDDKTMQFLHILEEMITDENPRIIATKFLNCLANVITELIGKYPLKTVLCGGVFQNRTLMEKVLSQAPRPLYFPQKIAINDGGICVGQIYKVL